MARAAGVGALTATLAVVGACQSVAVEKPAPRTAASSTNAAPPPPAVPATTVPPPVTPPPSSHEPDGTAHSTLATWVCAAPSCRGEPWSGAVVPWPEWAAYQGNGRRKNDGRDVYSAGGRPLYPYMGEWANGCEVTAVSGLVEIIEWKRGSDKWRTTRLRPGETHVIALEPPEDSAMLEAPAHTPAFSVSLKNCTPKPLP